MNPFKVQNVNTPPPDPEATKRLFANLESRSSWSTWGSSPPVPPSSPRPTNEERAEPEEEVNPFPVPEIDKTELDIMKIPQWSGVFCSKCGGEMVRTGACYTCPGCGDTTGCG